MLINGFKCACQCLKIKTMNIIFIVSFFGIFFAIIMNGQQHWLDVEICYLNIRVLQIFQIDGWKMNFWDNFISHIQTIIVLKRVDDLVTDVIYC